MNTEQNGGQQPELSVENVVYEVSSVLSNFDDKYYYELNAIDSTVDVKSFYIDIDSIVLTPGFQVSLNQNDCNKEQAIVDGSILNIVEFDLDLECWNFDNEKNEYIYSCDCLTIFFHNDFLVLNTTYSALVVDKLEENSRYTDCYYHFRDYGNTYYELKLEEKILLDLKLDKVSIKNIYISSDKELLNGFKVNDIKLDPRSFFDFLWRRNDSKFMLFASNYSLSKSDLWLSRKKKILEGFNAVALKIAYVVTFVVLLLNIASTHEYFSFPLSIFIVSAILFTVAVVSINNKVNVSKISVLKTKDDLKRAISYTNIIGTLFSIFFIFLSLLIFSSIYEYKESLVYDTENKAFLKSNSVIVPFEHLYDTDYITKRFIPIKTKYSFDIVVDNTSELPSFSKRYIDLEVYVTFYKGDYLLDQNLSNKIKKVAEVFTMNVNNGLYGNLYTSNKYEYQKTLIDIEEDINNIIDITLKNDKHLSFVLDVSIDTKYAKLQNVDE